MMNYVNNITFYIYDAVGHNSASVANVCVKREIKLQLKTSLLVGIICFVIITF